MAKPTLRFPEFTDEWEETVLEKKAYIYDGTHQTPQYVSEGIKFVSVENIHDIYNTDKFISEEAYKKYKIKPQIDDILMTRITAGIIGDTAIISKNEPLAYYVSLALIRKKEKINAAFLAYNINSNNFKHELHKRIIHVAFPKKINLGDIGKCEIAIPKGKEQQKIADLLFSVDNIIQIQEEQISVLEEQKKGVMQKLFNQEVRFKVDDGSEYPEWEEKELCEILTERNQPQKISEDAPLLAFTIKEGVINPEDKKTNKRDFLIKDKENKKFLLTEYNDIIYNPANLKLGAIHRNKFGRGVVSPIYAIFCTNEYPAFIEYVVTDPNFIKKSLRYLEGTVIKLMTLKPKDFLLMKIKLPSKEEQQKIADCLSAYDEAIQIKKDKLEIWKEIKKGLLQQMFV